MEVRRLFHKLRSANLETFNELFKGIFDAHDSIRTKGPPLRLGSPTRLPTHAPGPFRGRPLVAPRRKPLRVRAGRLRSTDWQQSRRRVSHAQAYAASLIRVRAATLFDNREARGEQAKMAKLLASQASWRPPNACLAARGGRGFACEYDLERKFRKAKLFEIAPISNNLVLAHPAQQVLGMPQSS